MTRNEAVKLVIEKLEEIQEIGTEKKVPVTETTMPIGGIPGFDSMNGVEFAAMIDEIVRIGDIGNLCASKDGSRALRVGEIADRILEIIS
jgi:hypothetical protein